MIDAQVDMEVVGEAASSQRPCAGPAYWPPT